jgi:hypothetical protein
MAGDPYCPTHGFQRCRCNQYPQLQQTHVIHHFQPDYYEEITRQRDEYRRLMQREQNEARRPVIFPLIFALVLVVAALILGWDRGALLQLGALLLMSAWNAWYRYYGHRRLK